MGLDWRSVEFMLGRIGVAVLRDLARAAGRTSGAEHWHAALKVLDLVNAELSRRGVQTSLSSTPTERVFGPPDLPVRTATLLVAKIDPQSCAALIDLAAMPGDGTQAYVADVPGRMAQRLEQDHRENSTGPDSA